MTRPLRLLEAPLAVARTHTMRITLSAFLSLAFIPPATASVSSSHDAAPLPAGIRMERLSATAATTTDPDGYLEQARALVNLRGGDEAPEHVRVFDGDQISLRGLPAEIAEPVAGILAAVHRANALLGPTTTADLAEVLGAQRATLARWPEIRRQVSAGDPAGLRVPAFPGMRPDDASAQRALLLVAASLDAHLEALRAVDAAQGSGSSAECDVLDETPDLCVASEVDSVHTKDARLLIDLGGNDTYRNSAGGAPFVLSGNEMSPVSVNIDLAGNDTYEGSKPVVVRFTGITGFVSQPIAAVVSQGSGVADALGLLVDERGNDTYTAAAPEPTTELGWTVAAAQGASVIGVGALFDGAGNDRYEATAPSGKGSAWITAQGGAIGPCTTGGSWSDAFVSVGKSCWSSFGALLSDIGTGNDTYLADAGEVLMEPADERSPVYGLPARGAFAQGAAWIGTGILSDDGGTDSLSVTAHADVPDRPSHEKLGAATIVWGQGVSGFEGVAGVLEGNGPTTYELSATAEGAAMLTDVVGQGQSMAFAESLLEDRGGDDRYTMTADVDWRLERVVTDPCECDGAVLKANGRGLFVIVDGQGMGILEAAAQLHDLAGNDTYLASSTQLFDVTLRDELQNPASEPSLKVNAAPRWSFFAQGAGRALASGTLVDDSGNDTYRARTVNTTRAHATSRTFARPIALALPSITGGLGMGAQGYGETLSTGQLLDAGGSMDRVEATVDVRTVASPDPRGAFQSPAWGMVQGAGGGGLLSMKGANVVALSSPSRPVCPEGAVRGAGVWRGCTDHAPPVGSTHPNHQAIDGRDLGIGNVPNGLVGAEPTLEFTPATDTSFTPDETAEASADLPRLHAEVRVTAPGGAPVVGAPVTIDLQRHCPNNVGVGLWQVEGTTDDDGIASADLPLWLTATWGPLGCTTGPWRLYATYDGREGVAGSPALAPIHAALPLTTS